MPLEEMQQAVNVLTVKLIVLNKFISDAIDTKNNPSNSQVLDDMLLHTQEQKVALMLLDLADSLNVLSKILDRMEYNGQSDDF